MKLAEESSSSSSVEDETSAIVAEPMNSATPTAKPTARVSRTIQKGILLGSPFLKHNKQHKLKQRLQMMRRTLNTKEKGRKS